ncbi:MAG: ATP-binding protein [Myxococcales bacterium]
MRSDWERVRRVMLAALLGFAVAGLAQRAWTWGRRSDAREAEHYARALDAVQALNVELTSQTLKTRLALVGHYDGLVQAQAALVRLHARLREPPRFLEPALREGLVRGVAASERESRRLGALLERFKTENALVRNSLLFLPVAARALDAFHDRGEVESAFKQDANALVRDVLLLRFQLDPAILGRISARLDRLAVPASVAGNGSAAMARLPSAVPNLSSELSLVLEHARAVREHAPVVEALVSQIVDPVFLAPIETLRASYDKVRRQALERSHRDDELSFGLLLCAVVAGALYVIARMRLYAEHLQQTSEQLAAVLVSLREEQAKQRELSELKTRFVSMTSHEFRTPLSAIMSSSEMLEAYDARWGAQKKGQHFARIRTAVIGMTRMLDAVLMIGRADAGKLEFKPREVDLAGLCEEVMELAARGAQAGHRLDLQMTIDEPVFADESLLRHVIENLLSNAIKYSPNGGRVSLCVGREGDELAIEVRDEGIGISERDREHLFEAFHRGENVAALPGTGLGLSVVKRALDLHGGSVEVESAVGRGTTFKVRVPYVRRAA